MNLVRELNKKYKSQAGLPCRPPRSGPRYIRPTFYVKKHKEALRSLLDKMKVIIEHPNTDDTGAILADLTAVLKNMGKVLEDGATREEWANEND